MSPLTWRQRLQVEFHASQPRARRKLAAWLESEASIPLHTPLYTLRTRLPPVLLRLLVETAIALAEATRATNQGRSCDVGLGVSITGVRNIWIPGALACIPFPPKTGSSPLGRPTTNCLPVAPSLPAPAGEPLDRNPGVPLDHTAAHGYSNQAAVHHYTGPTPPRRAPHTNQADPGSPRAAA